MLPKASEPNLWLRSVNSSTLSKLSASPSRAKSLDAPITRLLKHKLLAARSEPSRRFLNPTVIARVTRNLRFVRLFLLQSKLS